jgi:ubiquinone biosynthesis protein
VVPGACAPSSNTSVLEGCADMAGTAAELRILLRALGRIVWMAPPTLARLMLIMLTSRRHRGERAAAEFARLLERLAGAFVKAGQLLATRVDLVGETLAGALGRLHDSVEPMNSEEALRTARTGLGRVPTAFVRGLRRPPAASGSIACVYRAELDGRAVAVKVRRPNAEALITADMALMRRIANLAARLPAFRGLPLVEIVEQIADSLVSQLDFTAEAASLRRLHDNLASTPGVVIPEVIPELCGEGIITMEFIEGLGRTSIDSLPEGVRRAEVATLVRAVYRMLFVEGLIHVDLHQGNVYFMPDGRVVVLDAGFVFQMSPMAHRKFTEFFGGMIRGDGEACADILLSTVRRVGTGADVRWFRAGVAELVTRNAGVAVEDFNLPSFCVALFDLQRRHGLYAEPEFVFPLLCLLTLEGTIQRYHPQFDFQMEAAPYVMHGLLLSGDP